MSTWWNPTFVPPDLRKRAVYLYNQGHAVDDVAERLLVSKAGIYRWINLYNQTGDIYTTKEVKQQQNIYKKPIQKKLQQTKCREILYASLDQSCVKYLKNINLIYYHTEY